jgi:hypothetical protein
MPRLRCRVRDLLPDQVTAAIDAKAAGAISGSAIVKIIEKNVDKPEQMLAELKAFVTAMKAATQSITSHRLASCQTVPYSRGIISRFSLFVKLRKYGRALAAKSNSAGCIMHGRLV